MSETSSTSGARDHARAQAGATADAMPTVPASRYPMVPEGVEPEAMTWAETVAGGGYASKVLARGTTLRLTDRLGDACAHVLIYNADQPWERLNVADTVKIPWQAYLGPCHPLLSDQGRVLATIVADHANGSHDALCGCANTAAEEADHRVGGLHGQSLAVRELLLLAAAKHGLGRRDIAPSVSFFKGVSVSDLGELEFTGSAGPGGYVELRMELPVIVLIANSAHPLDPSRTYACGPLELLAWRSEPTARSDYLWSHTPELERAFLNTADYANARGLDD
jgi:urea carboxylase-associated protein 2